MTKYDIYDVVVSHALEWYHERIENDNVVCIAPFNPCKKTHKLALRIAIMYRNIWRPTLTIKTNKGWLTRRKWNKNQEHKIEAMAGTDWENGTLDPEEFSKDMARYGFETSGVEVDLDDLYDTYYSKKGELNEDNNC